MENALALFESLMPELAWPVHLTISAVYILTVTIGCHLLGGEPQSNVTGATEETS